MKSNYELQILNYEIKDFNVIINIKYKKMFNTIIRNS